MIPPPVPNVIPAEWAELMHTGWSLGPHPASVKRQAELALEQIAPFAEPVTEALVRAWFMPIPLSVSNPKPMAAANAYIANALMLAVGTLPAGAFTEETQRELLRSCKHWPSAAEVYQVLDPAAANIRRNIAGLKRMIAASTKADPT